MGYSRVQTEPFSLDQVLAELRHDRSGGTTFYVGTVRRDDEGRRVEALTYEAFPEMAAPLMEDLRQRVVARFRLVDAIAIHRVGRLGAGEPALLVALSGVHRAETFAAVAEFMDGLKKIVPIWKREEGPAGAAWIVGSEGRREAA